MILRRIAVLDAPSNLGLRPPSEGHEPGVRGLPAALRSHGLVDRLAAEDAGAVTSPEYSFELDPVTGYRNGPGIAQFSVRLADRVGELLAAGRFPVLLGGDCSIVLGPLLALRRRGAYGLAFLDGHDDYSPPREPSAAVGRYTAAGLDLGLATGHGPDQLTDIDGLRPYVREEHTVHLGLQREPDDALVRTEDFEASGIRSYGVDYIREFGAAETAARARADLEGMPVDGFWIHVDADVLHASVMPAVDSPNPNGLSFGEFAAMLRTLLASPRAVGFHVGIYDPELDPSGDIGAALVDALVYAFGVDGPR